MYINIKSTVTTKRDKIKPINRNFLSIEKFFDLLAKYYSSVLNTNIACRFFVQAGTFSFELHDRKKFCFTKDSLILESDVYYNWYEWSSTREEIISDIKRLAKLNKTK